METIKQNAKKYRFGTLLFTDMGNETIHWANTIQIEHSNYLEGTGVFEQGVLVLRNVCRIASSRLAELRREEKMKFEDLPPWTGKVRWEVMMEFDGKYLKYSNLRSFGEHMKTIVATAGQLGGLIHSHNLVSLSETDRQGLIDDGTITKEYVTQLYGEIGSEHMEGYQFVDLSKGHMEGNVWRVNVNDEDII